MATANQSIREIISSQPSAAAILNRFDIDICAHADESLCQACADLQLSLEQVLEKLENGTANLEGLEAPDLSGASASRLIQHIVRVHHNNVRRELPRLADLAHKVARKHGGKAPKLTEIAAMVNGLHADLFDHIRKEEQVLFPYIAQVEEAPLLAFRPTQACFTTLGQPIFMMVQEHEAASSILATLRELTSNFEAPAWACASFVALYAGLRAFDADMKQHVYLENDILFPRAIAMEAELNTRR